MTTPPRDLPLCLREAAPHRDPRECPARRVGACCEGDPDCAARASGLELLSRAPDDVVLVLAGDGRIVDASDRAAEVYGFRIEELVRMNVRDLRGAGAPSELEAQLARVRGEGAARFDSTHRRRDGSLFPVEVSARAIGLRDGASYVLAVVRDATARRTAEQAAWLHEQKFQAAFRASGVAMVLVGADGRILEDNPAACALVGHETLVGRHFLELSDPSTRALLAEGFRAYRDGAWTRQTAERRFVRADGEPIDVVIHGAAVRDAAGAFQFVVAVLEDVTEKRRLEAQLVHTERLVSLGTLAAGVAHEVNNPLAYVISNLGYAVEATAAGDPDVRGALADALEGAQRVAGIVADLRAFARGDDASATTADLAGAVRSAIVLAQSTLRRRARLTVELPALPPVRGARTRLCQVFVNLLVNAAEALDEARLDHEVAVRAGSGADLVWVEVSDTGAGIPAELRGRVFDPFFTTKPSGVGTGLGLFVSHGIVTRVGGRIEARAGPAGGTVFRVELPVASPTLRAAG